MLECYCWGILDYWVNLLAFSLMVSLTTLFYSNHITLVIIDLLAITEVIPKITFAKFAFFLIIQYNISQVIASAITITYHYFSAFFHFTIIILAIKRMLEIRFSHRFILAIYSTLNYSNYLFFLYLVASYLKHKPIYLVYLAAD